MSIKSLINKVSYIRVFFIFLVITNIECWPVFKQDPQSFTCSRAHFSLSLAASSLSVLASSLALLISADKDSSAELLAGCSELIPENEIKNVCTITSKIVFTPKGAGFCGEKLLRHLDL